SGARPASIRSGRAASGRRRRGAAYTRVADAGTRDHIDGVRGESTERVVLVFPGALGDLLLALPALRALRARHAGARVTAVVNQPLRALVELAGVADETAALEGADAALLFGGERLPRWLGGRPFIYSWLGGGDDAVRPRCAIGRSWTSPPCSRARRSTSATTAVSATWPARSARRGWSSSARPTRGAGGRWPGAWWRSAPAAAAPTASRSPPCRRRG